MEPTEANFGEIADEELAPVRAVAASAAPYRGGLLPEARAAVTSIKELIEAKLTAECSKALAVIETDEKKIAALPEYDRLTEDQRFQVVGISREARQAVGAERFISGVRDRLSRYSSQDYPAQLELVARLAAASGGEYNEDKKQGTVRFVPATSLKADCGLAYISEDVELDRWLKALRAVAAAELAKGNRISL